MKLKSIIAALLITLIPVQLFSSEIHQWRGSDRSGIFHETGLLKVWPAEGPKLNWSITGLGQGFSSVTVLNDKLYTTGVVDGKGFVFCISTNGKLLWKKEYGKDWTESFPGTRTTLVFQNNRLFMATAYGEALCLDANNGNRIWSVDMTKKYGARTPKWGIVEAPVVLGNKVFFTPGGGEVAIVALNTKDGSEIWKSKATGDPSAYCSPLLVNHKGRAILVTSLANHVVGIDPANGNMLWTVEQKNIHSIHPNTPLYHDGKIYSVTGYKAGGVMFQLSDDGKSVTELWRNTSLDSQMGGAVWINNFIVGSGHQNEREWQALDPKTGNVVHKTSAIGKGVVVYADGLYYVYADNGEMGILELNNTGFVLKSKFRITLGSEQHWAHPVINKGILYIRHGNTLMAYNIKK